MIGNPASRLGGFCSILLLFVSACGKDGGKAGFNAAFGLDGGTPPTHEPTPGSSQRDGGGAEDVPSDDDVVSSDDDEETTPVAPLEDDDVVTTDDFAPAVPDAGRACPERQELRARDGWIESASPESATDQLHFEVDARSSVAGIDALIALGNGTIDDFSQAAVAVRFSEDGIVDARDGAEYRADTSFTYEPAIWYRVAIDVDLVMASYDVSVGTCGEPLQVVVRGANFREDVDVGGELNSWGAWSSQAANLDLAGVVWESTGGVDCVPSTCQELEWQCGDTTDECGQPLNCGPCPVDQTCSAGACMEMSVSQPLSGPNPNLRGPTGQWPPDFPPYNTPADVVTDGSIASLDDALHSAACEAGCVIEHGGDIDLEPLTRSGSGNIVVRPPIGERADYQARVVIDADDVVVAGYRHYSYNAVFGGINSGFAWTENDVGDYLAASAREAPVEAFFYEVVYRQFGGAEFADRMNIQALDGNTCNVVIVGSILTGGQCPAADGCHADTIQVYNTGGGTSFFTVRDSIIWPSWDKGIQGIDEDDLMDLDNVMLISPSEAMQLWPGISLSSNNIASNAVGDMINSTLVGGVHPAFELRVTSSEVWNSGETFSDQGGNTALVERPLPPKMPTHEELDVIWSP